MKPVAYRTTIIRTIKEGQTKQFKSLEDLVDRIIERMNDLDEAMELAGNSGGMLIQGGPTQATDPYLIQGLVAGAGASGPSNVVLPTADVTERIRPGSTPEGGLVQNFTKDQLFDYYTKNLPLSFQIQPPGFSSPLTLERLIRKSPGDWTFVKISYGTRGSDPDSEHAILQVSSTDSRLDADKVFTELKTMASKMYSPTPKKVEPKFATPPLQNLEQGLAGAPSVETDERASDTDMAAWGADRATTAAVDYNNRMKQN